jgi:Fur family ferric uptake transcriptional regulator
MSKSRRMTRQRSVILEELRQSSSHPSADELYSLVRQRLPRISLGTVYRNLELLAEAGQIQALAGPGPQKRFDGNPQPHLHVRCTVCGRLADVDARVELDWARLRQGTDFDLTGYNLQLEGICPECRAGKTRIKG